MGIFTARSVVEWSSRFLESAYHIGERAGKIHGHPPNLRVDATRKEMPKKIFMSPSFERVYFSQAFASRQRDHLRSIFSLDFIACVLHGERVT